jgi:glutamate synthase (NADPH/NADH) small chain
MMRDPKAFMKIDRAQPRAEDARERVKHYREFYLSPGLEVPVDQATRCMDCGTPFCHFGCPLGNLIPDFNEAVAEEDWKKAYRVLNSTNNFPEFTGRICPAPCEASCVLNINSDAVTIEFIEKQIAEKAFEQNFVEPSIPAIRTGRTVAVIGSGPAGLAAADQLNNHGHSVTVFEKDDKPGGLLRYGIPDFKLEKWVIDRRIALMQEAGINFRTNSYIGKSIPADHIVQEYDAVVLCTGASVPRDLKIPGRDLDGIHFAMDFLRQSNKQVAGLPIDLAYEIQATGKRVVVIGGGDTGADCVGTANRQSAHSVLQIELLEKPPVTRHASTPWPLWPMMIRNSTSHEEGCEREWSLLTKSFIGDQAGNLTGIEVSSIQWKKTDGKPGFIETGVSTIIPCELVLLAVGFLHPEIEGMLTSLNIALDERNLVKERAFQTNINKVYTAGDMRRGQSLVVWAIKEGRDAANSVHKFLRK